MLPVEIMHTQGTVILRARNSELIIIPSHVKALKDLNKPEDFSGYFMREALVNRSARKLFEAWLRKDNTVWPRIYKTIHKEIEMKDVEAAEELIAQATAKRANRSDATLPPEETIKAEENAEVEEKAEMKATSKKATATKKAASKKTVTEKKATTTKKAASKKTTTEKKATTTKKTTKKATSK